MEMDLTRHKDFSIELDCPPGNPRPKDLIESVLVETGLTVDDFDTAPPWFGHQTWILKESAGKDALFTSCKPTFKERCTALYNAGIVRYATW